MSEGTNDTCCGASALALGSVEERVAGVVGDGLPGEVGCPLDCGCLIGGEAEPHDLGAGVVDGRSSGARHVASVAATESLSRLLTGQDFWGYSNDMTKTAGQQLAATLRRIKNVGPRTRSYRDGIDVKAEMIESIRNEWMYPGYYQGATADALRTGFPALLSWDKHVEGYRIDGELRYQITLLTPYQFAGFLGQMIDAGVANVGDGERFFSGPARALVSA